VNQRAGILPECNCAIQSGHSAVHAPNDSADERRRVSRGRVVCLCERDDPVDARRVAQESMCVPVVTPAYDNDIARKIEALSAHRHRLAIRKDPHAIAANRETHGLAMAKTYARPTPLHLRGQPYQRGHYCTPQTRGGGRRRKHS
jgi:hypothetical protein